MFSQNICQCADITKTHHFSQRITAILCKEATLLGLVIHFWKQTDDFFSCYWLKQRWMSGSSQPEDAWSSIPWWIRLSERKQKPTMAAGASWRWFISEATADLSPILILPVQNKTKPSLPMWNCAHIQLSVSDELFKSECTCNYNHHYLFIYVFIFLKLLDCAFLFFFSSMLPKWSRPESFWQNMTDWVGRAEAVRHSSGQLRVTWYSSVA